MKKIAIVILLIMICGMIGFNNIYASDLTNKKIVSLVFDNSGSMRGEKAEYANYAIQSMISMLDKNDELNIVKMSAENKNNVINLKTKSAKQSEIDEIRKIKSNAKTPFQTVNTARDWLINRKKAVKADAEYWLIIITDGNFNDAKSLDFKQYMEKVNDKFEGMKFNAILVGIGDDVSKKHLNQFEKVENCTVEKIDKASKIIPTMFEISSRINSGEDVQEIKATKIAEDKVEIEFNVPIIKMNIFVQKNDLEITNIQDVTSKDIAFDVYKIATDKRNAKMNELVPKSGYLTSGKYVITFNNNVNLDDTQIKLFVRPAVKNELMLYKKVGNKYIAFEETDYYILNKHAEVYAISRLISLVDNSILDLNMFDEIDVECIVNGKNIYGRIENKEFVVPITLEEGKNEIYSVITADGYIKEKSNINMLNLTEVQEIFIQYNNKEKHIEVGHITLPNNNGINNITITNLPKGIVVVYDGVEYKENQKILLNDNDTLTIKANKKYREESSETVQIIGNENGIFEETKTNKHYFKITPKETNYHIVKADESQETIDLKTGIAKFKVVYGDEQKTTLTVDEVDKIRATAATNGYIVKTKINDTTNEIEVKVIPTIVSMFKEKNIKFNLEAEIKDDLGIAVEEFEFDIENMNYLKILLPFILILLLIITLIGYMLKNRFNKNAYFKISTEEQPYLIKDYTRGIRKYLPFVSNVATVLDLEVKAKKGNRIEVLSSTEEIIEVNGDRDVPKKINLALNNGEVVLNSNNKKIKYEYITLTTDEIIEELEKDSKKEEFWI